MFIVTSFREWYEFMRENMEIDLANSPTARYTGAIGRGATDMECALVEALR